MKDLKQVFSPLRVTLYLDGSGIIYDPFEPIHLDSLLASVKCRFCVHGEPPMRGDRPADIPLPLASCVIHGRNVWQASAFFPDDEGGENAPVEDLQYFRKRFRQNRVEISNGAPNLTNGVYRDYNVPVVPRLVHKMTAYAVGNKTKIKELLKDVHQLGRKRSHGYGLVIRREIKVIGVGEDNREWPTPENENWSLARDGRAMRWLPMPKDSISLQWHENARLCRVKPPYWNSVDRVSVYEIGEEVVI